MESRDTHQEAINRRTFISYLGAAGAAATGLTALSACGNETRPAVSNTNKTELAGQLIISILGTIDPKAQQALANAYMQRHPKVKIIWEPVPATTDYTTWLGTQEAAPNIRPDIVSGGSADAFRGYVNFDEYRKTINPYTNTPWDQTLDWDFSIQRNVKGERVMLPTRRVHIMWFYNKDIFDRANLQPPTNYDEFVQVSAKLKSSGITPLSINYQYNLPQWLTEIYFDQYHIDWIDTVRAREGDWNYDPNIDGKFVFHPNDPNIHNKYTYSVQRFLRGVRDKKLRFDTPQMTDLIKNFAAVFPKYATSDMFVIQDTYTPFLQQKVAMTISGSWQLASLTDDLQALSPERLKELKIPSGSVKPFNWGTFEVPAMQGPLVKCQARSVESAAGEYLSIIKKDQQQVNLALDFMMFWTCNVGYKPFNDAFSQSSAYAPGGPLAVKDVQDPPKFAHIFDHLKMSGNAEAAFNSDWTYWGSTDSNRDFLNMFQAALQGKTTPENFGKQLQQYVTDNFDRIIKQYKLSKEEIDNPAIQPQS